MKCFVSCKATGKGTHTFYLTVDQVSYYLFSQDYRSGVHGYFSNGVRLDEAFDFSKAKGNTAVLHTMEKMHLYIRYVEREYHVSVLRRTALKGGRRKAQIA